MNCHAARGLLVLVLLLFRVFPTKTTDADEMSDTLLVGASLTGTQTRISKNGIFRLGFFNLVGTENWYFGIWYAQIPVRTIIWVANREDPLQDNSGVLYLTENGSLVLSYGDSVIWYSEGGARDSSAVIRDTGNLVISGVHNSSEIIWESFDKPGNVWLPGMKMSQSGKLISWKSRWDPSPGIFSLQMDPAGANNMVLLWNSSVNYWESRIWKDRSLILGPLTQNLTYNFSVFIDGSSKYVTYSVHPLITYLSQFVMVLDASGDIRIYFWLVHIKKWGLFWSQPGEHCRVFAVCGAYGLCNSNNVQSCNCLQGFRPQNSAAWESLEWSAGCIRQTPLGCHGDGFLELTGTSMPPGAVALSLSMADCQKACLNNCSCTAYSYDTDAHCQMWFTDLLNLYNDRSSVISLFVRIAASDVPKPHSKKKVPPLMAAAAMFGAVGGLIVVLATVAFVVFLLWRRFVTESTDFSALTSLTVFSYRELQNATKDFSVKLGGGGFGSVFKGTLADKSLVAVKKLECGNERQREKQFRAEVSTVGIIHHVNLVRLRGFCLERSSRMLVYEYMPNGSLDRFLFCNESKVLLNWHTRFRIALGTARGIHYLHDKCIDCIIHCDIKPENILLDTDFCPKVADFGLAKGVGRDFSHVLTTTRGTRGYLAPEWISGLPITPKVDVYSFGVTLLEIIAGRRNTDADPEWSDFFFSSSVAREMKRGKALALLDKRLKSEADAEQVWRAAMVGGWCLQEDEDARPSIAQVLQMLEGTVDVPVPPIPISLRLSRPLSTFKITDLPLIAPL